MSIDLSLLSGNQSMSNASGGSKRPNLFNEKSTSRERILTKKLVGAQNDSVNASAQSIGTPSFNIATS